MRMSVDVSRLMFSKEVQLAFGVRKRFLLDFLSGSARCSPQRRRRLPLGRGDRSRAGTLLLVLQGRSDERRK